MGNWIKRAAVVLAVAAGAAAPLPGGAMAQGDPVRWFVVTYLDGGRPVFDGPHPSLAACEEKRASFLERAQEAVTLLAERVRIGTAEYAAAVQAARNAAGTPDFARLDRLATSAETTVGNMRRGHAEAESWARSMQRSSICRRY